MTTTDELARGQYRSQQVLAREAAQQAQRAWRQIDPGNIGQSWRTLLSVFLKLFIGYQGAAVRGGIGYAGQVVDAAGAVPDPIGVVNPASLIGIASDGRDLESLLETPMIDTFADIQRGVTAEDALRSGLHRLVTITATQVADAGRVATGLAVTNDRAISGYVRIVTLPACGRCILLAGREYSHSTGFQRHERCDCTMRPLTADEWDSPLPGTDPQEMFEQMTAEQQAKAFTVAGARAIRDGADIGRVVNARRGMSTAAGPGGRKIRTTTEATTVRAHGRGAADLQRVRGSRYRRTRSARLLPEQIYEEAARLGWDRTEVVRQLKRAGYIF